MFLISLENFFSFFFLVFDFVLIKFARVLDSVVNGYASIALSIIDKSKLDNLGATLFGRWVVEFVVKLIDAFFIFTPVFREGDGFVVPRNALESLLQISGVDEDNSLLNFTQVLGLDPTGSCHFLAQLPVPGFKFGFVVLHLLYKKFLNYATECTWQAISDHLLPNIYLPYSI